MFTDRKGLSKIAIFLKFLFLLKPTELREKEIERFGLNNFE